MYCYDYKYSKDNIFILSLNTNKNNIKKGFLDLKIFSTDGTPVDNANIRVNATNKFNEYNINIDASGYYPALINDVQFYPGYVCKLNVNLFPKQSNNQKLKLDKRINKTSYENIQISHTELQSPQDEIRERTLSLGMVTPKDTISYLYAEKFAEEVNTLSNGKIKINIYTDAILGREREMLHNLKLNDNINFSIVVTDPQVDLIPKLAVFDIPMVYSNIEELRDVINNVEFYEKISSDYLNSGYKLLGIIDEHFRQLTTNKEIQNIDDITGIRIRTIQNHNQEAFWRSLGATVIPMPFSEIYTALRHGFIDSTDNPYENIVALKLYELQKYIIKTNHLPHLITLITGDNFYNTLSSTEKAIIDEAAARATLYAREKEDERIEERIKTLNDSGITFLDLPEETKQAMREKAIPVYNRIRESVNDDELINLYVGNNLL